MRLQSRRGKEMVIPQPKMNKHYLLTEWNSLDQIPSHAAIPVMMILTRDIVLTFCHINIGFVLFHDQLSLVRPVLLYGSFAIS